MESQRLDVALTSLESGLSRSQAAQLIRRGHVRVLDAVGCETPLPKTGFPVHDGMTLIVERPEHREPSAAPEDIPIDVRYEDEDLLVVNKPAGIVVHPAPGHAGGTLVNALAGYCNGLSRIGGSTRPGIVHRLDKNTSGLLLVAKTDAAHMELARQLAERVVSREYRALVWGHPGRGEDTIETAIGRSSRDGKKMAVDGRSSKHAITRYRVLEKYQYTSWLRVNLQTGRTHQIRVHLRHIGHPVVGDPEYGGRTGATGVAPQYRKSARELLDMLPYQALHATCLTFRHPTSGEIMSVGADPPQNMAMARLHVATPNAPPPAAAP